MARKTVVVARCPECDGDRAADIVAEYLEKYNSENYDSNTLHRVLKCRGCNHVQFQIASTNSEDIDHSYDENGETVTEYIESIEYHPPIDKRPRPAYTRGHQSFSSTMVRLLNEAYSALNYNLHVVAAIALRTVFDASTEVLGIDGQLTFKEKLDKLLVDGKIDLFQRDALDALTDAGSAAAHRGWQPTESELDTMFTIMESFLYRAFITSDEQRQLCHGRLVRIRPYDRNIYRRHLPSDRKY